MTPTPSTDAQIRGFLQAFNGVVPAETKQVPVADRLAPFREHILARRKMGFSWRQIATALANPATNLHVSVVTVRRLFAEKPKHARRAQRKGPIIRVLPPPGTPGGPPAM